MNHRRMRCRHGLTRTDVFTLFLSLIEDEEVGGVTNIDLLGLIEGRIPPPAATREDMATAVETEAPVDAAVA